MARTVTFDVLAVAKGVGFDELGSKIKGVARDSQTHVSGLVAGLTAIGPAMIPIAAATAAVGAGLAGLGAAGLVAFLGLREQWKQGTLQATALGKQITQMNVNFAGLKATTATAIAPGLTAGLRSINTLTVPLGFALEKLATQFGRIAGNVAPALVLVFLKLMPLFTGLGDQLVKGSAAFLRWAQSGTGVTKFVEYAQANLPRVEKILAAVVVAIGRLSQGLLPLGGLSLSTVGVLAKVLNLIPVPVLKDLAPIIYGIVLATKGWEIAQKALNLVMETNPFLLVATLIIGVGVALVEAYKHSQTFRDVVKTVFKDVELAFLYAGKFAIQYLLIPILNVYSAIVHGAAAAFGWVPGIGGKLKGAARAFDDFRRGVDKALTGIKVQIDTLEAGRAVARMHQAIDQLHSKQITISTYIQEIILPTLGTPGGSHDSRQPYTGLTAPYARAAGGPVIAGQSYIVGEQRAELFTPAQSGYITPYVPRGGNTYIVNVLNGDPRATVRALEQFVGGGGKIHISRGIA